MVKNRSHEAVAKAEAVSVDAEDSTLAEPLELLREVADAETVVFNTGEGLKTLDAVEGTFGPTYRIRPSLRAAKEAGLFG